MKLHAFPSLKRRASVAAAFLATAVMSLGGLSSALAQSGEVRTVAGAPAAGMVRRVADPYRSRFPNVVLRTHEGKTVRFYDDLLKGKIVLINFMYATCTER